MDMRPEQPPEGRLIADALTQTGMSIRKASRLAGISYGRWRQITSGYQNVSPGSYARVHAPARTLARMAAAVDVEPEQLDNAGRPDAAAILREMQSGASEPRTQSPAAWEKLGKALQLRRMQLGYAHGQRRRFVRERGWAGSEKTVARFEQGALTSYPDETIYGIEILYGLLPGSIDAYLKGGEFTLADDPGTVTGLTPDEARTVRAFVELLRRGQDSGSGEQRGA